MTSFSYILGQFRTIQIADIIDIILIAYIIFKAIKILRDTRALQLVNGVIAIVVVFLISYYFGLKTINFVIRSILQIGILAVLVLFQPEIRRALTQVGKTQFLGVNFFSFGNDTEEGILEWKACINAVCEAASSLSRHKTGALIVFERQNRLGDIVATGTQLSAQPSPELLENLFFTNSPLHDGAVIIRRGKLLAAGCYLPLSDNYMISKELGTRHRAALGVSEVSDAIVVVVSEETGKITITDNGQIKRGLTIEELKNELTKEFATVKQTTNSFTALWKGKKQPDEPK